MPVESRSVKLRKKEDPSSSTEKFQRSKDEQHLANRPNECDSQLQTRGRHTCWYFGYIAVFGLVLSGCSWLLLCATFCKELEFCRTDVLANFKRRFVHLNASDVANLELNRPTRVPNADDTRWLIERRADLSLSEFIEKYDGKRPVLITDVLKGWKANEWNKEFFVQNYGDQQVVMKAVHGTLSQAESLALPIKLFAQHSHQGAPNTWTYLQDELFIQLHPELRDHLGKIIYLEEDFFQMFPKEVRPWNAMLLWGTAYSRSYLHIDPYNWTGTNAVFSGKKLWKLYPPGQDEYLYVIPGRKSEFPLNCYKYNSPVDAFNPDLKKYPNFAKARAISFAQKPGELLIIPPGWFHQAFNQVETIAVSSQVMNSQNYHIILEEIFKAGNVDRRKLPSDFYQLPAVDQVMFVANSLPSNVLQRGREVTKDILQQMGYPTSNFPQTF